MYNFRFYLFRYLVIFLRIILPQKFYKYIKNIYKKIKDSHKHIVHENTIIPKLIINKLIDKVNFVNELFLKSKLNRLKIEKIKKNKSNKKILLVIGDLTYGGAERQIIRLANNLVKKNYNVLLVSNTSVGTKYSKHFINTIDKKVKVFFLKNTHPLIFDDLKKKQVLLENFKKSKKLKDIIENKILNFLRPGELFYYYNLHKFVEKNKPDIIHSYLDFWNVISGLIGLNLGIKKIVLSCRNMPPNQLTYHRYYFLPCYRFFKKFKNISIINNSKAGARAYEKWMNTKTKSIKINYNFFEFKNKKYLSKRGKKQILLGSVGRLAPEKNYIYLIELFNKLYASNYKLRLMLIGEGYLKSKIIKSIKRYNLNNVISILSPQKNILKYMNNFDCFILTSKLEGTPNVLLEAQTVGTPIVTTSAGGIPETIVKNYSGYLISGNDIEDDKRIILRLFNKKNFFKKRDIKVIKSKLSHFNSKNVLKKLLKIYEKN